MEKKTLRKKILAERDAQSKAEREAKKLGYDDVLLREARRVVRRRKAQTINRHLKTANAYIKNVALGQFPQK